MKPVQGYKCDYCHRVFGRPVDAHNHEASCKNNPKSKRCVTCINCKIKRDKSIPGYEWAGETIFSETPTCLIADKPIYDKPYLDECETTTYGHSEEERELPGTCFNYEYKGYAGYEKVEDKENNDETNKS